VYLVGGDHDAGDRSRPVIEQGRRSVGIDLGEGAWVGAGATILDGVTLGDRAIVGAGAVVREAVPAGATVVGIPARPWAPRPRPADAMAVITIVTSAPPLTKADTSSSRGRSSARSRRRTSRGNRHDAVQQIRAAGPGVSRELADRRRDDGERRARRPGHLAEIPELRRPSSKARVLAGAHDARVLRPLGSVLANISPQGRIKERIRRALIRRADTYFFKHHVKKMFTISGAVATGSCGGIT
jgi:hypothetical protein